MSFWKTYKKIVDFLVPDWLFKWLKKYPYGPLIIVIALYIINLLAPLVSG